MAFLPSTVRSSSVHAARSLLGLGLLLAGFALPLLAAGAGAMVSAALSASSPATSTRAGEPMTGHLAFVAPTWTVMDHGIDPAPDPSDSAPADVRQTISIDFLAAALFGPPDRQPRATLVERFLTRGSGEEGEARSYLEQTAAARWLAPRYRVIQAWDETSGYGAVEASRADRLSRASAMQPSLGCVVGAEPQETPSCSAVSMAPDPARSERPPALAARHSA